MADDRLPTLTGPDRSPDGRSSPSSRIQTMSRWRAAARWRARPTPARRSCCSAPRAASRARSAIPSLVPDGDLGRVRARELAEAAAVLGLAEVTILDHPDGDLRWADVPAAARGNRPDDPALSSRRRHHVRRGRPLLASRSHRHPRADVHRRPLARRRRAAALLRDDAARRDARGGRGRARQRRRAARLRASGASSPTRSATPPSRRPSSSTSATGPRASSPRCAATGRRWDRTIRSPGSTRPTRAAISAPSSSAARRSTRPATPSSSGSARRSASASKREHIDVRDDTLDLLRCPYCGGRLELVESSFHEREDGEITNAILGCHCCVFPSSPASR